MTKQQREAEKEKKRKREATENSTMRLFCRRCCISATIRNFCCGFCVRLFYGTKANAFQLHLVDIKVIQTRAKNKKETRLPTIRQKADQTSLLLPFFSFFRRAYLNYSLFYAFYAFL
jgi:hypothetical protein